LAVAEDESSATLQVTATSTFDATRQGSAAVAVPVPAAPAVTGVTVSPPTATVERGGSQAFAAAVAATGGAPQTVTWQVSGNASADTRISADGLLAVAAGESAATLQVTATSTFDATRQGSAAVAVPAPSTTTTGGGGGAPSGGGSLPSSDTGGAADTSSGGLVDLDEEETPLALPFLFTDVKESDWFYGDVYAMWENNLMNGTSETLFSPNSALTRAMVVTVLYRMEGSPDVSAMANPFPDVPAGQYYTDAVRWAAGHGIVLGYTNGEFGPNDNITREQMAAILHRYEQYAQTAPPDVIEAREFADGDSISEYAKAAVAKLVTQGVITGKPNDIFDPKGNATRAEFAAVLHRFMEAVKTD
jgi:hypothetical protein